MIIQRANRDMIVHRATVTGLEHALDMLNKRLSSFEAERQTQSKSNAEAMEQQLARIQQAEAELVSVVCGCEVTIFCSSACRENAVGGL
jgi:chromosome segregation ATPase